MATSTIAPPAGVGGYVVIVFDIHSDLAHSTDGIWACKDSPSREAAEACALQACGAPCAGVTPQNLENLAPTDHIRETWARNGSVALAASPDGHWATSPLHDGNPDMAAGAAIQKCSTNVDANGQPVTGCKAVAAASSYAP